AMSRALGEPAPVGGLHLAEALVVPPATVLAVWLADADLHTSQIARIDREGGAWRLRDASGADVATADIVCLAAGLACRDLAPDVPLSPVRGQADWIASAEQSPAAIGAGYVVPTGDGFLFGATHDRDDDRV